jgi:hypothetical protein
MTAFEQLDYVRKYLAGMGKWRIPGDTYLMVFWPSGVGKPDDYLIGEKGNMTLVPGAQFSRNKVYEQNKGLDANGDGRITAGDVRRKVLTILAQSEAAGSIEVNLDDEAAEAATKSAEGTAGFGVLGAIAAAALGVVAAVAARAAGYLGGKSR